MVVNICRRLLGNAQAIEETFQAAFMVLAKKAGTVRPGEPLAAWLYGVTYRVALNARRADKCRPRCQSLPCDAMLADSRSDPLAELTARDLLALVEEEVQNQPNPKNATQRVDLYGDLLPEGAVARLGTDRFRHGIGTFAVRFLSGGKILAASGKYKSGAGYWDTMTGQPLQRPAT
jgi:Sigma-70 region 2